jgi:DNA-binding NtrC family response regulator
MKASFGLFIGASKLFVDVIEKIPRLSACDATVLISGETGTGKDLYARAIHYHGPRKGKPFVPVNCAALPDHLVENELFGHAKGAFTGAGQEHKGLLAEAEGGTLFLDEINSLNLSAQGKLLGFLQDREYRPLGSSKHRTVDVRIIAATNSDLKYMVQARQFREDLFHRLNVLSVFIPPLRERIEDVASLAHHFLTVYGRQHDRTDLRLSGEALHKLLGHEWPGNVREMEGVIQRAVILSSSSILQPADIDLPSEISQACSKASGRGQGEGEVVSSSLPSEESSFHNKKLQIIEQFERTYLTNLLVAHQGNITQAAKSAKKERRSFQRLLRKHGLDRRAFQQIS